MPKEVQSQIDTPSQNKITVLIGKNGVGKTSLMVDLADFFRSVSTNNRFIKRKSSILELLSFQVDGKPKSLDLRDSPSIDNDDYFEELRMYSPPMVIVAAMTPYDPYKMNGRTSGVVESYLYIGHKRGNSANSPIYNILERIVSSKLQYEKIRISATKLLNLIGFHSRFILRYKWTIRSERIKSIDDLNGYLEDHGRRYNKLVLPHGSHSSETIPANLLWEKLQGIRHDSNFQSYDRYLDIPIDFSSPHIVESRKLEDIQVLRQYGLLSLLEINTSKADGRLFNLQHSSSGELSMMTSLLGILSGVKDGSLILIDEPEVSLHPDWQSKYIDILVTSLRDFCGIHIIIATHSPLIISGGQDYGISISSLEPERIQDDNPLGRYAESSDFILLEKFGTLTEDNLYLRELVLEAIRLTGQGEFASERYATIIKILRKARQTMEPSGKMYGVIGDLIDISSNGKETFDDN